MEVVQWSRGYWAVVDVVEVMGAVSCVILPCDHITRVSASYGAGGAGVK